MKDLWQATMMAAVVGGLAGGGPDVAIAIIRRFTLLIQAGGNSNYDYDLGLCLDPRLR